MLSIAISTVNVKESFAGRSDSLLQSWCDVPPMCHEKPRKWKNEEQRSSFLDRRKGNVVSFSTEERKVVRPPSHLFLRENHDEEISCARPTTTTSTSALMVTTKAKRH
ncbi:hypothetical protein MTP99_019566 [Tenebrio molitor]|jgi:hypothetical protein|nr:hypothetical protein MTP99_019566 [Tenebrio molitor]